MCRSAMHILARNGHGPFPTDTYQFVRNSRISAAQSCVGATLCGRPFLGNSVIPPIGCMGARVLSFPHQSGVGAGLCSARVLSTPLLQVH